MQLQDDMLIDFDPLFQNLAQPLVETMKYKDDKQKFKNQEYLLLINHHSCEE